MKKLQAELKGRAQVERENRDIYLEQIKLKAQEQRQTILEGIKYFRIMNLDCQLFFSGSR